MLSIGFKEILVIAAIVGGLVWMRLFRTTMDRETVKFFQKLKGPEHGEGFGWKGLLIAFVAGLIFCCTFALIVLRIWGLYHAEPGG